MQTALNSLKWDIICAAVSGHDGSGTFLESAGCGRLDKNSSPGGTRVAIRSLPRFIGATGVNRLLLKVDVEGEENKIFPELLSALPQQSALHLETHHGLGFWFDLSAKLQSCGFETHIVRNRDPFVDAVAIRNRT